ncbi:TolC family protein [Ruegeria sediminis]|uniref:TolC family protein n=1 Tax=Ruegeria sediminis TaxID=2583820 RepID=A0ABY2WZT5_9RHOB|nr:TolC family protein [Ruegeria sediminis]TMV08460.1 TolC family protein [Ruegeria sediminis]
MTGAVSPLKIIAVGVGLLAVAGCETPVPPSDGVILEDALPEGTVIPAAWSTSGAPSSAVKGDWVASFRDPNLTNLVNEALRNNRDMAAAVARVEAAMQTVVIAGSPLLPQIGLEAGAQASRLTDRDGRLDLNRTSQVLGGALAASWEIDVWGRLRSDKAASAALAGSIADDARFLQQSIAATVARSWVANIEIAQLAAVSREATEVYENLLIISDERAAAGAVSDFDVVQARARVAAAKAATSQITTDQNTAIGSLEVLLGRYPGLRLKPAASFPRMPGSLPASGLPLSLLDRRPDVSAARNKVKAAFYNVKVAELTRLPGISLNAAGGALLEPNLSLLGTNPDFLRIGVNLLQPIFAGGAIDADVARMTSRQAAAVAEYGQTVLEAFKEVETALANEKALRAELANWQESLKDSDEALELANDRYVQGTIDMTGLLVLQQFQLERQVNVIQAQAALLNNRILLYMALGEPI